MFKSPEITVYITNFNYGRYIKKSIQSVLNQTFKNYELLILDDGSTDNSIQIIKSFSKKKNIRFIFQKNKGLNKSNTIAIKAAKGKFVLRLDADDYIDKNALLLLYNQISASKNIGLVYSDYYLINNKNEIQKHVKNMEFKESFKSFYHPAHGACSLIRKSFIEEVNFYDQRFKRQDGVDIWYKFLNHYKIKKIDLPLFYYRQHNKNLSGNKLKIFQTKNKILRKFSKRNIKNIKNLKIAMVIPIRKPNQSEINIAMSNLGNKKLILWTIDEALNTKFIDKVIISTNDFEIINFLKKIYRKKLFFHKRKEKIKFENKDYNSSVIESIRKHYKKKPDILIISHFTSPFKKSFYYEKAINTMLLHKNDRILSLSKDIKYNLYKFKKGNLVQINEKEDTILKLERNQIYQESGGLYVFNYEKYLKYFENTQEFNTNYIILDKKSCFEIYDEVDLQIANKVIKNIKQL